MLSRTLQSAPQVATIFVVNGFLIGLWGGLLASVRDRAGLAAGDISVLLVVTGCCAAVSMQVAGRLADRIGARRPTLLGACGMMLALTVLAGATSWPLVLLAAALVGLGNGAMDVSMNSLAVDAERASSRRIMSTLHAFFSVGSLLGASAVLVAQALTAGVSGTVVVATLGGVLVTGAVVAAVAPSTPESAPAPEHHRTGTRAPLPPITWLLAVMAILFGLTEGTGWDWSSIHVTDVTGVSPGVGATGLALFSAAMIAVRLAGDAIVEVVGARWALAGGGWLAAVGYLVGATQSGFVPVLAGWLLVGAGVAVLAPLIYGMAGHLGGGRMLAVVAGAGYVTVLAGPALIGWAGHHWGMATAMFVPLCTALLVGALALTLPREAAEAAIRS
ncbi:Fucose permease [Kytococcus aerolatus]|uniref:Fucose permease n=1 Tax=Kytococcus aerolatus TaxID=592308 RepID=A0A212U594_9MICO|nr:MFS transporter [Kytococcus aerolatus]SNC73432.1 Fucose permease [Kytococcus aerolatus]